MFVGMFWIDCKSDFIFFYIVDTPIEELGHIGALQIIVENESLELLVS